jgi:hypothetical protein
MAFRPDSVLAPGIVRCILHRTGFPANLCLFLRGVDFRGVGEDLEEAAGNTRQKAAWGVLGKGAAEHFQNVLGELK